MPTLTIEGVDGALTGSLGVIVSLAKELLHSGYQVLIDATPVALEFYPGYDVVVWRGGQALGSRVDGVVAS